MRTCVLPLFAALLGSASLIAGAAGATRLSDALALAYRTNPSLLAQREALKALDEQYVQARANFGPQVSLNSQLSEAKASVENAPSFFSPGATTKSHARTDTQSLSVSQLLLDGGQVKAAVAASEADILAGRQQLLGTETQLLQQVVNAYVGVRRDRELLNIATDAEAMLLHELTDTEARFKVHEVTVTDREQAIGRLAAAQASVALARARLQVSEATYLEVVGQNPDDLEPPPVLPNLPPNVEQAFDVAELNSPTIRAAQFTERGSLARTAQERGASRPSLSARLDYLNAPEAGYDPRLYEHSTTARLVLSAPLYASGLYTSRIRAAIDRNNRDRLLIDNARRQVIRLTAQAWSQMLASQSVLTAGRVQVDATTRAYNSIRAELKAGLRTTIEVLNAEQELQSARQTVVQAEGDEYVAQTALLAAIGQLRMEALAPDVEVYRPERNFKQVRNKDVAPWVGAVEALNGVGAPRLVVSPAIHDPAGEVRPKLSPGQDAPITTVR